MIKLEFGVENGKNVEGLLTRFIQDRASNYAEPTRKGTQKGAPIGFSRAKHIAVLLALSTIVLKEQARTIGVSYGLLRKWRTEERFNEAVDKYAKEFAAVFCNHFRDRSEKEWEHYPEWYKELLTFPLEEFVSFQPSSTPRVDFLGDIGLWNEIVIDHVGDRLVEILQESPESNFAQLMCVDALNSLSVLQNRKKGWKTFHRNMILAFLGRSIRALLKSELSREEKLGILRTLRFVRNWVRKD